MQITEIFKQALRDGYTDACSWGWGEKITKLINRNISSDDFFTKEYQGNIHVIKKSEILPRFILKKVGNK